MKGILLLSDGIDSPVAGHMMQEQGMELQCLNFRNDTSQVSHDKVKELVKKLKAQLATMDHTKTQEAIKSRCNPRYQCVLCKRVMYRAAEQLASEHDAEFIVTGENLGQVASQTLENMRVLDSAVQMTVLRPLLGFDKDEIIQAARKIGTFDISSIKSPSCCFVPHRPVTMAKIDKVLQEEKKWIQ